MKLIALVVFLLTTSFGANAQLMFCPDIVEQNVAWGMSNSQINRFLSDMTLPRNARASTSQKISRVQARMNRPNYGNPALAPNDKLAELIVWAADCTGNDFTMFTGILEQESRICDDRHNEGGGDSGCGQFTSAAVHMLQNQLRLSRAPSPSTNGTMIDSMNNMIAGCFQEMPSWARSAYPTNLEGFKQLFNQSSSRVRQYLRSTQSHVLPHDLVAVAAKLKFHSARAGGYTVPGSRPGGLQLYHSGPHSTYYSSVNGIASRVQMECIEDIDTPETIQIACEMSEDPDACLETEYNLLLNNSDIEI